MKLEPTGTCWCGCGQPTKPGRFFVQTHDRTAESAVIKVLFGDIAHFLAHHGFSDTGRNARQELTEWERQQS